jgi:hypothetical protein
LSVVWVVHRTVQRSQASNERVVHTQEVLTAIESVLATIVDADTAVRSGVSSAEVGNPGRSVKLRAPSTPTSAGWRR